MLTAGRRFISWRETTGNRRSSIAGKLGCKCQVNKNGDTPLNEVMGGRFLVHRNTEGVSQRPTLSSQMKVQGEIISILQGAGASMDQPNAVGKTPSSDQHD